MARFYFTDSVPIGPSAVHLHAGAAVDSDGGYARVFQGAGQFHSVQMPLDPNRCAF